MLVWSEKSRLRRFFWAIVSYICTSYILDIGRTGSPVLFSYTYIIHDFQTEIKFSLVGGESENFVARRFEKLISWYFVTRAQNFCVHNLLKISKPTPGTPMLS